MLSKRSIPARVLALALMLCLTAAAPAVIIYVDDSAPPPPAGANDGSSWDNAFLDLQDALTIAKAGDEIRVGRGVYKPVGPGGLREASFTLPDGLVLQGGYAGFGAPDPDSLDPDECQTILSGDLNGDDGKPGSWFNYADNSYHVVRATGIGPQTQLRGVTVRAGNATAIPYAPMHDRGAGIFIENGSLTLVDCIIEDNQAYLFGGGIGGLDVPTIACQNCVIQRNRQISAKGGGAGAAADFGSTFTGCRFEDNRGGVAACGGAICGNNFTVASCVFIDNFVGEDGAAIASSGDLAVSDSLFLLNVTGYGGAIHVFSEGTLVVSDSLFQGNMNVGVGAAISASGLTTVEIRDCTFEDNQSSVGGALRLGGTTAVIGSRFEGNSAENGGAIVTGATLDLVNCVFDGNSAGMSGAGVIQNYGQLDAANCRFTGNWTQGGENPGDGRGGVLYNAHDAVASLTNCTIAGNLTAVGSPFNASGALHNQFSAVLTINNAILFGNRTAEHGGESAQVWNKPGGTLTINNSCIEGWTGSLDGVGNHGNDPNFIDADGSDNIYGTADDNPRLRANSPCIDSGDGALLPPDTFDLDEDGGTGEPLPIDLDGLTRVVGANVDMGAFEFQGAPCQADINGNNAVDVDDLITVILAWGACAVGESCPADLNLNMQVDVDDLIAVILSWGACP